MTQENEEKPKLYTEQEVREISLKFFYHWYNAPGNNTEQGFTEWFKKYKDEGRINN